MSKKSPKADSEKSLYQLKREEMGLTRAAATDPLTGVLGEDFCQRQNLCFISEDRLEKIETGRGGIKARAEEIETMVRAYKAPELYNYYCSHDCDISKKVKRNVDVSYKDLGQIALDTLSSLHKLEMEKDSIVDIFRDGQVDQSEEAHFFQIKSYIDDIVTSAQALQLWVDKAILDNRLKQKNED